MPKPRLQVRVDQEDLERIEAYQNRENLDDTSDAVRKLLRDQLDAEEVHPDA